MIRVRELRNSISFYLFSLLIFYIGLVPYYYLPPVSISQFDIQLEIFKYTPAAIIFLLTGLSIRQLASLSKLWKYKRILICAAGFLLVSLISLTRAAYPFIGFAKLAYYTFTGIWLIVLVPIVIDAFHLNRLYYFIIFSAALVSAYGLLVYVTGSDPLFGDLYQRYNPYRVGRRVMSSRGNPLFLGTYLLLCYPIAWVFAFRSHRRRHRVFGVCACLLIVLCMLVTFSRSIMVGWIFQIGVLIPLTFRRLSVDHPKIRSLMIAAVCILCVQPLIIFLCYLAGLGPVVVRVERTLVTRLNAVIAFEHHEKYRLGRYKDAILLFRESPWVGIGYGNLTRRFAGSATLDPRKESPDHSMENMYAMWLCEIGVVGFLTVIGLLYFMLKLLAQEAFRSEKGEFRFMKQAIFVSLSSICLVMFLWDALREPTVRMMFWCLASLGLYGSNIANSEPSVSLIQESDEED